jgi:hypothetical protein
MAGKKEGFFFEKRPKRLSACAGLALRYRNGASFSPDKDSPDKEDFSVLPATSADT